MQKAFHKTVCILWFCLKMYLSLCIFNPNVSLFLHKNIQKGTLSTSGNWDGRRTGSENFYFTFMIFGRSSYFTSVTSDWTCPDWVRCSSFLLHSILDKLWSIASSQQVFIVCYLSIRATTYKFLKVKFISVLPTGTWHIIELFLYSRNFQQIWTTELNSPWLSILVLFFRNRSGQFDNKKVLKALKFKFF